MTSMSYCRYRNAVEDMHEYIDHLSDDLDSEDASEEEVVARNKFIRMCHFVAEHWEKPE